MLNKSYVDILPEESLNLDFDISCKLLKELIGVNNFCKALKFEIKSPVRNIENSSWIKTAKIVGINPRIVKTYWGIIKYAMTFPENAVHIMPLWESGDGSLYVQNSWRLNRDFYDKDLEKLGLNSCEKQLKFVVNILHSLGKCVGFDVMPHVDNFSEIVILNPDCFEWIKLNSDKTSQDFSISTDEISKNIKEKLIKKYNLPENFYDLDEKSKEKFLFSNETDRFEKRMEIRKFIRDFGFEPLPVVEHFPMRPVKFERLEYSKNDNWAVFDIENKSSAAIIIGAVTPYKYYKINDGYPEKNKFDKKVLDYFVKNINKFQAEYDFDFLRGDMAHNQISQSHNEYKKDLKCPEMWEMLKKKIQENKPYFATFAESFLSDYYISGAQDMMNKNFDVVLGELNYKYLNHEYLDLLYKYIVEYEKYKFSPLLTIFSNDGDLSEQNKLYASLEANECRYFVSMFMNTPSYMGMGFEIRDLKPEKPEQYSNAYVKVQKNDYQFGKNIEQFEEISRIRKLYLKYKNIIKNSKFLFFDKRKERQIAWVFENKKCKVLCAVNLNSEQNCINIPSICQQMSLEYTNSKYDEISKFIYDKDGNMCIENIYIGEFVLYKRDK